MVATFSRLSSFIIETGTDPTKLGRWSWILVGSGEHRTRIISAYQPNKTPKQHKLVTEDGKMIGRGTVSAQHQRYFMNKGNLNDPRDIFRDQLLVQLKQWRARNEEIILFADLNEDIYTGPIAQALLQPELLMEEQTLKSTGIIAPPSHFTGSHPIVGTFATPGIVCTNSFLSPHGMGVGDHRFQLHDFDANSLLGTEYPKTVRPSGRALRCDVPRIRKKYIKRLKKQLKRHKIEEKLKILNEHQAEMPREKVEHHHNKIDEEVVQQQVGSEKKCNKFYDGKIEFSPEVGIVVRRGRLYRRILDFKHGKPMNHRTLKDACKKQSVLLPSQLTIEEVKDHIKISDARLKELEKTAPQDRAQHLQSCYVIARDKKRDKAVRTIQKMMRKEAKQRQWKSIRNTIHPQRGSAVARLTVKSDTGEETLYATREGVERQASRAIAERYKKARTAPILKDKRLFTDFGYTANTPAASQVLEGTYNFPEGMDFYTKLLLQEAHLMYQKMTRFEIEDIVSTKEFQLYWRRANENVQSSASGIHFGHLKAAGFDKFLASIYAAKLSLASKSGIPLKRWETGLTILLEKSPGNISIDKMRAICLFEADFNYLNKYVFAKQMMDKAFEADIIPPEQFAKKGSQANQGVLASVLFCDISRTQHKTAAVVGADLADCFDSVTHTIASIALQSFKVRVEMVAMMLTVIQKMSWHLRTTFGQSETPFGGTTADPSMGIGQGSTAAPPSFTSQSTLMMNAYKTLGHGAEMISAWTGDLFKLAALLYVDDSDLLHSFKEEMSDDAFLGRVQVANDDWGGIVKATGGALKPAKCLWYMMAYKFNKNGTVRLKSVSELPKTELTIPQANGVKVPIPLKPVNVAEKKLGVYTCPDGDFSTQLSYISKSGLEHAARLRSGHLHRREARLSVDLALMPKMLYGGVAISAIPTDLEKTFMKVYFHLLPSMGVNRNINQLLRMLPQMFQGLGLLNPNIEFLSAKISEILNNWDSHSVMGQMLKQAYQTFQLDVGLGGNIFDRSFEKLGKISSTYGWFCNLWELLQMFKVTLRISNEYDIPLLRVNDKMMMDAIIETDIFTTSELMQIQRVRHYKKVSSVADIVLCDGMTVDPEMWNTTPGESSRDFPLQRPSQADFQVWKRAIGALVRNKDKLRRPLGDFISKPHKQDVWFINDSRTHAFYRTPTGRYQQYIKEDSPYTTRFGARYRLQEEEIEEPIFNSRLSIMGNGTGETIRFHSASIIKPPPTPSQRPTLVDRINQHENQSLWTNLRMEGDGEWLYDALIGGTLEISHDGSYQVELAKDVCSCGVVFHCTATNKYADLTWAERSTPQIATNYRGEILGGLATQLFLKILLDGRPMEGITPPRIGCDNMGVVKHAETARRPLLEKQVQADVLRPFKRLIAVRKPGGKLYHIYSHSDKHTREEDMSLDQRLNIRADKLAGNALAHSVENNSFINITSSFPMEKVTISVGGCRINGSPKVAIYKSWGRRAAKEYFISRKYVSENFFDHIYWDGMEMVMKSFPQMFRTWITKQVAHFNGTNRQLSRWDKTVKNVCPNCQRKDESTSHITRCTATGRRTIFKESVSELRLWLQKEQTDRVVTELICKYLEGHGESTMESLLVRKRSKYTMAVWIHDKLGWDNFLEGRICSAWLHLRQDDIRTRNLRRSAGKWMKELMRRLLQITHQQWTYRNATVHLKVKDGRTMAQHEAIVAEILECAHVDPAELLEEHKHLVGCNFTKLVMGPVKDKVEFVAEMNAARRLARHVAKGTRVTLKTRYQKARGKGKLPRRNIVIEEVLVDNEGSLRWRRRKRM
jgi:hypothetical protein